MTAGPRRASLALALALFILALAATPATSCLCSILKNFKVISQSVATIHYSIHPHHWNFWTIHVVRPPFRALELEVTGSAKMGSPFINRLRFRLVYFKYISI